MESVVTALNSSLMNLHREMADNMLEVHRYYRGNHLQFDTIRRGRYNRYLRIKAKLALIRDEILHIRPDKGEIPIRVRLPPSSSNDNVISSTSSVGPTASEK